MASPVPIVASEDDHVVVDLGHLEPRGRLEIDVDGGATLAFQLDRRRPGRPTARAMPPGDPGPPTDPWSPT